MSQVLVQIPSLALGARPSKGVVARRIRFATEVPLEGVVLRSFDHPRHRVAVAETVKLADLPTQGNSPAPTGEVVAVMVPPDAAPESRKAADAWMTSAGGAMVAFATNGQKIQWRPGNFLVQTPLDSVDETLATLVEFAFYESELRRMEDTLGETEVLASADVARAHRVRFRDRKHWARIGETIEMLYRMRLEYARLESQLVTAPVSLPRDAGQIMSRLIEETQINDRLEAFSNRLEACEDLYEGANDRIADHRWFLTGHALEIGIILFLVIETVLIATDLYLKHW